MTIEREDPLLAAVEAIEQHDAKWKPGSSRIDCGEGRAWRPDMESAGGRAMLIGFGELGAGWHERLLAVPEGTKVVLALGPDACGVENLELALQTDARVLLLEENFDGEIEIREYGSAAYLVAREGLVLEPAELARLGIPLLDRALAETNSYRKGLLFEYVLCLLFSQSRVLDVIEHRYTNETEEIDLVLANRAVGHMAGLFGGPLVLVSAKNEQKGTGAPEVRALRGNMAKRRKRCNFGILCSAGRITETAAIEQMETTDDPAKAIALLDGKTIRSLLGSSALDADLEIELRKAVLRE